MTSRSRMRPAAPARSPYSTVPISHLQREIRLVELQRNEPMQKIKCVLRSYPVVGPHPPYIALSYAWGRNVHYADIELNGYTFSVGRNLWHFLNQMRSSKRFDVYWIDAICIDQKSLQERNHQVQMMRQIYSNAESVYAWLGEEDEATYSNVAMTYLAQRNVFEAATVSTKRFWTTRQAKAVLSLCKRVYWTRIWIVQELLLAKVVTVLCGSKAIPWCLFERFFGDVATVDQLGWGQHTGVNPTFASAASKVVQAKYNWKEQPSLPLLTLLRLCRHQQSTDIRDRIYALCGLANDSDRLDIDYGITAKQLLSVVFEHTCTSLKTSLDVSRSRKQLLQTGKLLQDLLKVYLDDEELETMIIAREYQLSFHEECLSIVAAGLAHDTSHGNKEKEDLAAVLDDLRREEARISLTIEANFKSYMEQVYRSELRNESQYSTERHSMYFHFKGLHEEKADGTWLTNSYFKAHSDPEPRIPPRFIDCVLCRYKDNAWNAYVWKCTAEWCHRSKDCNLGNWLAWGFYLGHIEQHHSKLETYRYLSEKVPMREYVRSRSHFGHVPSLIGLSPYYEQGLGITGYSEPLYDHSPAIRRPKLILPSEFPSRRVRRRHTR